MLVWTAATDVGMEIVISPTEPVSITFQTRVKRLFDSPSKVVVNVLAALSFPHITNSPSSIFASATVAVTMASELLPNDCSWLSAELSSWPTPATSPSPDGSTG